MSKLRVGVIFGGRSGEHEVSLMSARSVMGALDPEKYTLVLIAIDKQGAWWAGEDLMEALQAGDTSQLVHGLMLPDPTRPGFYTMRGEANAWKLELLSGLDVVFPVLHGTFGEDGTLQGLLEMADVAYVGAGVLGSSVGMDKALFKDVMRANGLPVVESLLVLRSELEANPQEVLARAEAVAPYPLFVKPVNLGSSVGITKCRSRSDLYEGLLEAARYDRRLLVERGVDAREIEVSVLGNEQPQASIPGEIVPGDEFYSYDAKYYNDRSEVRIPASISPELVQRVQDIAVRAYRAVDCAGMARVDFFLERSSGELFLSEINTIPGFTSISMYPKLWAASGLPYPALLDRLINLALERKADRDRTERRFNRS